jgi:hypothetical protein
LDDVPPNEAEDDRVDHRQKPRPRRMPSQRQREKHRYLRFLDLEAAIDSDEDVEGDAEEEDDVAALEAEELEEMDGFINDSSQLGTMSQEDELDRADPEAKGEGDTSNLHRAYDADRERHLAFATPALNRRQLRRAQTRRHGASRTEGNDEELEDEDDDDDEHSGIPSSEKGLGRMHFIRSVLDHHRRGGDANEVEELYRELLAEQGPGEGGEGARADALNEWEEPLRPQPPAPVRFIAEACEESGSDPDSDADH